MIGDCKFFISSIYDRTYCTMYETGGFIIWYYTQIANPLLQGSIPYLPFNEYAEMVAG